MLNLDFAGICIRDSDNQKAALIQKKTESMFCPEGITLDFGHGSMRYLDFECSDSFTLPARCRLRCRGSSPPVLGQQKSTLMSAFHPL